MRKWYNGYHFSESPIAVYNPFGLLNRFATGKMEPYWFSTCTPTFLLKLIENQDIDIRTLENLELAAEDFGDYRKDKMLAIPVLYHAGYLTITGYDPRRNIYTLDYPNDEVCISFAKAFMIISAGYPVKTGGKIRLADAERLLDDWALHYRFVRHQQHRFAFSAKSYKEGCKQPADLLENAGIEYAFTGWSGAYFMAPYEIPQKWMLYVENLPDKPENLGLYPVEQGENVLLIIARDEGVFQRNYHWL